MENILVFAALGLLTGSASRLLYPGRQALHTLGTMLLGVCGAVGGGTLSWSWWPSLSGEFHTGNLVMAVAGATLLIVLWAGYSYQRNLGGHRPAS